MKSSYVPAKKISASIVENVPLNEKYFRLTLRAPEIASISQPGQFLMVKADQRYHPLLPRPFSIHRIIPNFGLQLLYHRVGLGTALLSGMQSGNTLEVLGPLGNGFSIPPDAEICLIIAGGMGIAPFPALIDAIKNLKPSSKVHLFFGAKSRGDLISLELCQELGCQLHISTEDGSAGVKGLVSQVFEEFLQETLVSPVGAGLRARPGAVRVVRPYEEKEIVKIFSAETHEHYPVVAFACGPHPMLRNLSKLALDFNLSLQISLESHMACGIGSCLGCPVKVLSSNARSEVSWTYERVCYEGPVFEANRIIWEG